MIGDTLPVPETKKPVVQTGASGAITALSISNFMDTHSVHHNAGMCKDSLIKSQNSLNVPAYLVGVAVPGASFRKESCYV